MTSFKVALSLEAKNTYRSCRDNHKDYNRLKREVAANVRTRKEVFIATLIVGCYADNLVANGGARACANRKRGTSTSRWNINPKKLAACQPDHDRGAVTGFVQRWREDIEEEAVLRGRPIWRDIVKTDIILCQIFETHNVHFKFLTGLSTLGSIFSRIKWLRPWCWIFWRLPSVRLCIGNALERVD